MEKAVERAAVILRARVARKAIMADVVLSAALREKEESDMVSDSERAAAFSLYGVKALQRQLGLPSRDSELRRRTFEASLREGYVLDGMLRQAVAAVQRLANKAA